MVFRKVRAVSHFAKTVANCKCIGSRAPSARGRIKKAKG